MYGDLFENKNERENLVTRPRKDVANKFVELLLGYYSLDIQ